MMISWNVAVWWLALLLFLRKVTRPETDHPDAFLSFSLSMIAL
jgi:hypothetical protein